MIKKVASYMYIRCNPPPSPHDIFLATGLKAAGPSGYKLKYAAGSDQRHQRLWVTADLMW